MEYNPWQVDSLQAFSFLKCPECIFDTKEEDFFQVHAIEKHPLSFVLFGKTLIGNQNFIIIMIAGLTKSFTIELLII